MPHGLSDPQPTCACDGFGEASAPTGASGRGSQAPEQQLSTQPLALAGLAAASQGRGLQVHPLPPAPQSLQDKGSPSADRDADRMPSPVPHPLAPLPSLLRAVTPGLEAGLPLSLPFLQASPALPGYTARPVPARPRGKNHSVSDPQARSVLPPGPGPVCTRASRAPVSGWPSSRCRGGSVCRATRVFPCARGHAAAPGLGLLWPVERGPSEPLFSVVGGQW